MKIAADQIAAGGNTVVSCGKKLGELNWDVISKALNRSVVQCKNTYKDEQRRIAKLTNKKGSYSSEEVCTDLNKFTIIINCYLFTVIDNLCLI